MNARTSTRPRSTIAVVGVALVAVGLGAATLTDAALTDTERVVLGADGVGGTYDIALVAVDGSIVQAPTREEAYVVEVVEGTEIPTYGTGGVEPVVRMSVVTTGGVTGPVAIGLDPEGSPVGEVALYTVAVDGVVLAEHLDAASLAAAPPVVDDWTQGVARSVTISVALPPALAAPTVYGGEPLAFAVLFSGASS